MSRLDRDPHVEVLVAAYRADLEAAGMFAENEVTSPARSFLLRVGVDGWSAMTLDQQLAVWGHDRRLVAWLIVTGRVRPTADYLVASKLRVGKVAAGIYRGFYARFLQIAGELGFDPKSAELQWWAVAKVAALAGVPPEQLTKAQLNTGREQLIAAIHQLHPDHPMRTRPLTTRLHGAEATLFHAGVIDAPPRKRHWDKPAERALQWAAIPPRLRATFEGYIEQMRLSLRPATMVRVESVLREFASWRTAAGAPMFDALGAWMAAGSRGHPARLLAMVFLCAATTTAVLSLDATVVLLTPIVFATAARLRTNPRPHVYACSHLANSASLLLPVSNLTNLLAFRATGLSFARFGGVMALPWLVALLIEWLVLRRSFAGDLRRSGQPSVRPADRPELPSFALAVVALTLVGFVLSSLVGIAPVWVAAAGAVVLAARERPAPKQLIGAAEPAFLVFVLGLGVVVHAASVHGLSSVVDDLLPHGTGLGALLAIAAISAAVANLLNNLPATLIILPVAASSGPGAVLAMLVGVNVGPNLTYVGSLATLLWRRIVHAHDHETDMGEFTRLGALTVPPVLVASTVAMWLALKVI